MVDRKGNLTPRELIWAEERARTGDDVEAARRAGAKSEGAAAVFAHKCRNNPAVINRSNEILEDGLNKAIPLAMDVIHDVLGDKESRRWHPKLRVDVAKYTLTKAIERSDKADAPNFDDMSSWTAEQVDAALTKAMAHLDSLALKAKDVTPHPATPAPGIFE